MAKRKIGMNVFDAALDRFIYLYKSGYRVVVSFSGGKDSGICLELAILAAQYTKNLPVDVAMRDEEIMFPGTFEYAERVANRPEVNFRWLIAGQPIINIYNRRNPYFWVFDDRLEPYQWVRQPPEFAEYIEEKNIEGIVTADRFPPIPGSDKPVAIIIGLRTQESPNRYMGLLSSKGFITKESQGTVKARPIYDWRDGDVWKAVQDNQWDYNSAYDVMYRHGVPRTRLRIAPPTMTPAALEDFQVAANAFPRWFNRVAARLPDRKSVV